MEKVVEKIKQQVEEAKRSFQEKTTTLILGGFGLIAALAWNEAIKSLFDTYFRESEGLIGKFVYALIITVIVVIVSIRLEKISGKK
jgi:ABC-type Mn2+/Zn2+ transport system permease subunit